MVSRISLFLWAFLCFCAGAAAQEAAEPVAVVELFTSEGCSSCPAADRLLKEMLSSRQPGQKLYLLAFHIDYWNPLGWEDRFSRPDYSDRQKGYADRLRLDRLYTPQMIVNGTSQFVGSDARKAYSSVREALSRPARVFVSLENGGRDRKGNLLLSYDVRGVSSASVVTGVLLEKGLSSYVARGENAGLTLRHENVVRSLSVLRVKKDGGGLLKIRVPEDSDEKNLSVVVYLQDEQTWEVLGAAGFDVI
ncbi:MAG: DUF1223 domain-containing protein [Candidatus Omnitrophica bacterium]|nr:DUF1223 domain-containing protein [Candidatus Omnitrophota bacterium]